jgi:hypothetical protein
MNRKAKLRRTTRTRKLVSAKRRIRRYNLLASREVLEQLGNEMIDMRLKAEAGSKSHLDNIIYTMVLAKIAHINIGDMNNETLI